MRLKDILQLRRIITVEYMLTVVAVSCRNKRYPVGIQDDAVLVHSHTTLKLNSMV
jgi:hypothetical protein